MIRALSRAWCALQHQHIRFNEGYRRVRFCRICDRHWTRRLHRYEAKCENCHGRGGFQGNAGMWLNCPHCGGYEFEDAKEALLYMLMGALFIVLAITLWRVS